MRRMWAAGAAIVACLALGGMPAIAQSPSSGPSPGAAAEGRTYIVAQDGSGDFGTIGGAVAAAHEGDTVLVRPGRYVESVVLDKAVSIEGDGDRAAIVIEGPDLPAVHILADGAKIAGLTLTRRGQGETRPPEHYWQLAVVALAADATTTDLVIADGTSGIVVYGSAAPTISCSDINRTGAGILVGDSAAPTITGTDIHENVWAIGVTGSATPTISGNDIHQNETGVLMHESPTPTISGNDIHENETGVLVYDSAAPTLSGNDIHENGSGIEVVEGATATVDGREVTGPYVE